MSFNFIKNSKDTGLLLMRIGIGLMFIHHGWPKLMGGVPMWEKIGGAIGNFGITVYPVVFGFLAAVSESLGGLLLILGIFFRPACFFLLTVMVVAATMHLKSGDGVNVASHAIELGFVFLSLIFIGPGVYSFRKDRTS